MDVVRPVPVDVTHSEAIGRDLVVDEAAYVAIAMGLVAHIEHPVLVAGVVENAREAGQESSRQTGCRLPAECGARRPGRGIRPWCRQSTQGVARGHA